MVARVLTVAFLGLEPKEVEIQVHISNGLPGLIIVGLVSRAVSEARERIRAALSSIGLSLPAKRIVVNLAPADFVKEGTRFDLPIALAILVAMGVLPQESVANCIALGELSLDGEIRGVKGVLPIGMYAVENGLKLLCPHENSLECIMLKERIKILTASSLSQIVQALSSPEEQVSPFQTQHIEAIPNTKVEPPDMAHIKGQYLAKRAAFVAACGGHNILLTGHPGTGKSMLASAFSGILPPLTPEEIIEVTSIYSIAGLLKDNHIVTQRPYRAPHHSASGASIIGGGRAEQLGEITLAHLGVLFLDELPEFERQVLDSLRQPLENGSVSIARADYRISYPARFQLFAAMNKCKCGYFGDGQRQCRKVPQCAADYEGKVSGPIMDRIDIVVEVETENPMAITSQGYNSEANRQEGNTTAMLREKVATVMAIQNKRYEQYNKEHAGPKVRLNADLHGKLIEEYCQLSEECKGPIQQYSQKFGLSMRGYTKVLKVARTIADTEGLEHISRENILEALQYRNRGYNQAG